MILADTHAWVFFLDSPDRLPPRASRAFQDAAAGDGIALSSISVWEISYLHHRGRLQLSRALDDWLDLCLSLSFLMLKPVDSAVAREAARLPDLHRDPADRFILATARLENLPLVTADRRLGDYPAVHVIW